MHPLSSLTVDEVQKTPRLIESIKAVHDEHGETRYILLGSSQILLMEQVRESLARRVVLLELYPLTLPEMLTDSWDELLLESRLVEWLRVAGDFWQRFVRYLEMSYQGLMLRPWFRNLRKRLSKASKIYFLDPGVERALLNRRGVPTGHEFVSAVVSEVYKQIKNSRLPVEFYHCVRLTSARWICCWSWRRDL
ncbi:MAG: AAA family ATPase [Candidatus Latescibacterota bacterium]